MNECEKTVDDLARERGFDDLEKFLAVQRLGNTHGTATASVHDIGNTMWKFSARELAGLIAAVAPQTNAVAWRIELKPNGGEWAHYLTVTDSKRADSMSADIAAADLESRVVPLYAHPAPTRQEADARDTSAAFDAWWDAGNLMKANPYNEGTPAFWAWEGWWAAKGEPK